MMSYFLKGRCSSSSFIKPDESSNLGATVNYLPTNRTHSNRKK